MVFLSSPLSFTYTIYNICIRLFFIPQPGKTSYQNASNCHPYFSSVKIQQIKTATKFQSKQLANTLHTILTAERYSISTPHPIFRHFSDIQVIKFHLLYESTKKSAAHISPKNATVSVTHLMRKRWPVLPHVFFQVSK